jgi:hypothetical protein
VLVGLNNQNIKRSSMPTHGWTKVATGLTTTCRRQTRFKGVMFAKRVTVGRVVRLRLWLLYNGSSQVVRGLWVCSYLLLVVRGGSAICC